MCFLSPKIRNIHSSQTTQPPPKFRGVCIGKTYFSLSWKQTNEENTGRIILA